MQHIIDLANDLTDRLFQVEPNSFETFDRGDVDAVRRAASMIAALAGRSTVHYIDHNRDTAEEGTDGTKVVAFTDSALIVIDFAPSGGTWALTPHIHSRNDLSKLDITKLTNAVGSNADSWPASIRVTLTYEADISLTLPFHAVGRGPQRQELVDLLASLTTNLAN